MRVAIILSGFGVIFALVTGLLCMVNEFSKATITGAMSLVFEVIGITITMFCLL